jgi:outer membrane protein, heavy metal efflux system
MSRFLSTVFPFLATVFLALHASAAPESVTLSIEEAVRRAEEHAPQVTLARAGIQEAVAKRVGTALRIPANPRLSGEMRPAITGGAFWGDLGYAATLDVPLDLGAGPSARTHEADRGVTLSEADLTVERRRARHDAFVAYVRAAAWAKRETEIDALMRIAERILNASATRAATGASGDVDESSARSELSVLQSEREAARRQRETYTMQLRSLLDVESSVPLVLTSALETPKAPATEASLIARALHAKPEIVRARAQVALLVATDERLRKELFPKLSVYLGVDAAPVSPIFGQLGVSVEIPVAQRNQQARAVTEVRTTAESARLELLLRQIVRDVTVALAGYESRRRELSTLTASALPAAERTLELVETGWLAGRFDIFRVTTAARDVARVRALRTDALEAAWIEYAELELAIGGSPL